MNDIKPLWQSRTVWSAVIALLATLLKAAGVADLGEAEQAALVDAGLTVVAGAGAAAAVWFRHQATKATKPTAQ